MQVDIRRTSGTGDYDVAIVGLGPVGAVLANLLGLAGIRTVVLEREAGIHNLPRAVHFDDEVMRIFQTIGVADAVANISRINVGMRFVDADGKVLLDWPRPQESGAMGWHPSYRFHQPDLERILRVALSHHRSVSVFLGTEVTALEQTPDGAMLTVSELADAQVRTIGASFVIGCDGARSLVRRHVVEDSEAEDLGFNENWLVVDVRLLRDLPELGDYTIQYCDPSQPITYVRGPGDRRRWEIALTEDLEEERVLEPDVIWPMLDRWITREDAEIERAAVYTFHSVIANKWRRGPFLIAGDAAHQTPPFMGQGMCAGIRDVANLGWKLIRCLRGAASERLLDSYQTERHPHVRAYTEAAVRLGKLVSSGEGDGGLHAPMRSDGAMEMHSPQHALGPGLCLKSDENAGRLFPQPLMRGGIPLDNMIGYGPALIVKNPALGAKEALTQRAEDADLFWIEADAGSSLSEALVSLDCCAALIRPDRYIFGTAKTPEDTEALIAEWVRHSELID
jgi:3-(3-hydroxy-phenyl)propionate hydroxylase